MCKIGIGYIWVKRQKKNVDKKNKIKVAVMNVTWGVACILLNKSSRATNQFVWMRMAISVEVY
jgi:hypothetical protein